MAATLNTAVNFCQRTMRGVGNCRKLDHQSASVNSDPKLQKMNLNLVDCRHALSRALFCWERFHLGQLEEVRLGERRRAPLRPRVQGAVISVGLGAAGSRSAGFLLRDNLLNCSVVVR